MANRNTQGFGLIPAGTLGATPSTGGQNKYKIDSAYPTSLYRGMPVQYASAGGANVDPGYIVTAQDAITVPTIGLFNGCFYTYANTLKPTFSSFYPGGTTPASDVNNGDTDAFVIDNPWQQYVGQLSTRLGANMDAAQVNMGRTMGLTVRAEGTTTASGSTISGQSNGQLTVGTVADIANQWRLLRVSEDPSNEDITAAYASYVVVQNLNQVNSGGLTSAS